MPDKKSPPKPPQSKLMDAYFQKITFSTHIYEGRRVVKGLVATIDGTKNVSEERVTNPRASLLPKSMQSEICGARDGVYKVLDRLTLPVDSAGCRLIPLKHSEAFVNEIREAIGHFNAVADSVVDSYDEIIEYNRAYWIDQLGLTEGDYRDRIGRLIPDKTDLRNRFWVEYRITNTEDLSRRFESAAMQGFFEEAAENTKKYQAEMQEAIIRGPIEQLTAALLPLREQIRTGTKITPASFAAINSAMTVCMNFSEIVHPEIFKTVKDFALTVGKVTENAEARKVLGATYTTAIKDNVRVLTAGIDKLVETCKNEALTAEMINAFGKDGRAFDFDDDGV